MIIKFILKLYKEVGYFMDYLDFKIRCQNYLYNF